MQKIQETAQNVASKVTGQPKKLPTAKLGKKGPQVTRIGYGTMGLSSFYGKAKPDEERFGVLDKCYADGELFWDTSDLYGDSEDLLGKWFKTNPGKRDEIFLATKFGCIPDGKGSVTVNSTAAYCRDACNKSLSRLGVPSIDLFYVHRFDGTTPVERTIRAMGALKREGKIKYLGLSECSSETLRRACKVEHIDAVQIEYSPFSLDIESPGIDLLKTCRELGVAVIAYSPLGRGMLGGKIRSPDDFEEGDFRKHAPRYSTDNFSKNLELVNELDAIAKKKGVTSGQLTLAWLLAQGDDIFPIPGTTNISRLEENLGALSVKLSAAEEKQIRNLIEKAEVAGERYPAALKSSLFADTPPDS